MQKGRKTKIRCIATDTNISAQAVVKKMNSSYHLGNRKPGSWLSWSQVFSMETKMTDTTLMPLMSKSLSIKVF